MPFEIPDSWQWVRMTSVNNIVVGATPSTAKLEYWSNGTIYWLPSGCCQDGEVNRSYRLIKLISQKGYDSCSTTLMKPETVLIALTGATAGKVGLLKFEACANQSVVGISPYLNIVPKFIFYQLMARRQYILSDCIGSAQPHISKDYITKMYFALPPLAEQERIVAEIEKCEPLIAEYDKLEQQKSKLDGEIYDKLKKSILQYAIQGKLVPQDENDEPASVLLEKICAEKKAKLGKKYVDSYIYKGDDNCYYEKVGSEVKNIIEEIPFDIPENWKWIRLGTLFQHNTGKALNSSNTKGVKRQYITTSNLYWGYFKLDNLREMLFTDEETEKCSVQKGDLLVCEGGDIGRAAIWNYDYSMCIQNHIHKLRPYTSINIDFYYYVFYVYKSSGLIGGKGIGIQGLSSNALDRLIIPLPPIQEQNRIIEKINIIISNIKDEI